MRYPLFISSVLAVALLSLAGCGKTAEVAQEKAVEAALSKDGVKAKVDMDSEGNAVKYSATTSDGTTLSIGENTALPRDFPADIPVLDGWKIQMTNGAAEKHMINVLASSDKTMDDVTAFYKKHAVEKGWREVTGTNVPGMMRTMEFEKENRMLMLMISTTEEKWTAVNLMTGDK